MPRTRYHAARDSEQEQEEAPFYEVSDTPYQPPSDIRRVATGLLLEIGMGIGTDPESFSCQEWICSLREAIEGASWEQEESLQTDSLVNLALRGSRIESVKRGSSFLQMILQLKFAAKINS